MRCGSGPQFVLNVNIIILHLEMSKAMCRDCLNLCLAEWVLLVRCHLPRAGLPLIHQLERLAVPASASCIDFPLFWIFFVSEPFLLVTVS